jgi:hypothetical protein
MIKNVAKKFLGISLIISICGYICGCVTLDKKVQECLDITRRIPYKIEPPRKRCMANP